MFVYLPHKRHNNVNCCMCSLIFHFDSWLSRNGRRKVSFEVKRRAFVEFLEIYFLKVFLPI